MKKKRKRPKNICPKCRKKMPLEYDDCPNCGGWEYYQCPKCLMMFNEKGERI